MDKMSKLEELIQQYCPDGVEYKTISELCIPLKKGTLKQTELIEDGEYPVINSGRGVYGFYHSFNNEGNALTLAARGEYAGFINYFDSRFWAGGLCYPYRAKNENEILTKFIYYWLKSKENIIMHSLVAEGSIPALNKSDIDKFEVPLPALPVQREIVRILDEFSLLSAELAAELAARKQQYKYYLNSLLDINQLNSTKIMYVGDLFEIKNGLNKEKTAFGKGTPIVNFTDVFNNRYLTEDMLKGRVTLSKSEIERYKVYKGDVFFTRTSETKEEVGMSSTIIEDIPNCTFSGFVLRAHPLTNLLLPKFCAYYFSTDQVRNNIVRYASFTTRATTSGPKLSRIPVPIIPIHEQQQIVDILDRFDMMTNDISIGIPAEIKARQKQYEYYRDKLLSFMRADK
ncbi:MAG: restriction endonuclease subunit S [Erysipelotrichaceae bacterium]|nr:restriction endonuclease subunit S [Erysipelotrichaceae bacterium]